MTTFDEVFDKTLKAIRAYSVINLATDVLQDKFESMLENTIGRLAIDCKPLYEKLNPDFTAKHMGITLDFLEMNIIKFFMVAEFLLPYVNDEDDLKQIMTDKEFRIHSQAHHMEVVNSVYQNALREGKIASGKYVEFKPHN